MDCNFEIFHEKIILATIEIKIFEFWLKAIIIIFSENFIRDIHSKSLFSIRKGYIFINIEKCFETLKASFFHLRNH